MAIPDFHDLVVTRLQTIFGSLTGITRAFKEHPTMALWDYPSIYPVSAKMTSPTDRKLVIERAYIYRLAVAPMAAASLDAGDYGAEALNAVYPVLYRVHEYLSEHPRLDTSTLAALTYLDQDVRWQDTGAIGFNAPGGELFAGAEITLFVAMRWQDAVRLS